MAHQDVTAPLGIHFTPAGRSHDYRVGCRWRWWGRWAGADSYATRLFDYEHSGRDQVAWTLLSGPGASERPGRSQVRA
jgi:hypothetical protein